MLSVDRDAGAVVETVVRVGCYVVVNNFFSMLHFAYFVFLL